MPGQNRLQEINRGLLLFGISAAYYYLFLRVLWRVGDEGTLVYGAQLVAEGALPCRDFFEVMGPGSFYWLALFFKIFGTHLMVARGVLLVTSSFTIVLLYWMTRRLYQGPFERLPAYFFMVISIPLWPTTNHHWDSIFFALLALAAFLLWQDKGKAWYLVSAGLLAGITSCIIQQKGLLLVVALLLVIWVNGLRSAAPKSRLINHSLILLAGYVVVGLVVISLYYVAGGLSDLVYANLIWPFSNYHQVNSVPYGYELFELFWPQWHSILQLFLPPLIILPISIFLWIPLLIIFALPAVILLLTVVLVVTKQGNYRIFEARLLPFWGTGLALFLSEMHRRDIFHLIYGSPLLLVLLLVLWNECWQNRQVLRRVGLVVVSLSLILSGVFNALTPLAAQEELVTRRGAIWSHQQDDALKFLHEHLQPKEEVFVYPYYPMYYFLANLNPHVFRPFEIRNSELKRHLPEFRLRRMNRVGKGFIKVFFIKIFHLFSFCQVLMTRQVTTNLCGLQYKSRLPSPAVPYPGNKAHQELFRQHLLQLIPSGHA